MKKSKFVFGVLVLVLSAVILGVGIAGISVQAKPPVPDKPDKNSPPQILIIGLHDFSLTGSLPGTFQGSDDFKVKVKNLSRATVQASVSKFNPPLTNDPRVSVEPRIVPQGMNDCTVTVKVFIGFLDEPGKHKATLTITATGSN